MPSFNPRRHFIRRQLDCPDASFDLLNDVISFFDGDAFAIDIHDFDMHAEEEMVEALAK